MPEQELLNVVHRGAAWGYLWRRDTKLSTWYPIGNGVDIPTKENLYFGVHGTDAPRGENQRARKEDVTVVACLFSEFDFKDFTGSEGPEAACRQHIAELEPQPSALVASGGGYHCYWFFKDPWHLDSNTRSWADSLQKQWVAYTGGDDGAKDLARVLRVPGTVNTKYEEPRPVELIEFNEDRKYSPKELGDYSGFTVDKPMAAGDIADPIAAAPEDEVNEMARALMYLSSLDGWRRDDYTAWLEVGMALRQLGDFGLQAWDRWSRQSDKYELGTCAAKWRSFNREDGLTLESLKHWAHVDNPEHLFALPKAPRSPKPRDYRAAIVSAGWEFRQNEANRDIELQGIRVTDEVRALINYTLRNYGYSSRPDIEETYTVLASENSYHPVMDYLDRLTWNGEDNSAELASYFLDEHDLFDVWLRRWLIGAVARVAAFPRGQQNRMLVMDGAQDLGKSYFVRWLAADVPDLHHEAAIHPDNKDDVMRRWGVWIWEAAELGSTVRRSDREALKAFISQEHVRERKPYGHADIVLPAMTSFIGTINHDGSGFLNDPTGSRRYMTTTVTNINWAYAENMLPADVWAHAYHLFREGEPWHLLADEAKLAAQINTTYEVEDPVEEWILTYYELDAGADSFTATSDIVAHLQAKGRDGGIRARGLAMAVATVLTKHGCRKVKRQHGDQRKWSWQGVRFRGM